MSNDPDGKNGVPANDPLAAPRETDFGLAVAGGSSFMKRLAQLGAAADRIDQATAQFEFGKDIKTKMAEAEDRLAFAKQKEADADRVFADAVADAKQKQAAADKILADASAVKAEAEAIKGAAARTKAQADKVLQRAEQKLSDAQAKEDAAIDATEASRQATAAAEAKKRELQSKLDKLRAAISGEAGQ